MLPISHAALDGEVISVIPHVRPTFELMGASAKTDFFINSGDGEIKKPPNKQYIFSFPKSYEVSNNAPHQHTL